MDSVLSHALSPAVRLAWRSGWTRSCFGLSVHSEHHALDGLHPELRSRCLSLILGSTLVDLDCSFSYLALSPQKLSAVRTGNTTLLMDFLVLSLTSLIWLVSADQH